MHGSTCFLSLDYHSTCILNFVNKTNDSINIRIFNLKCVYVHNIGLFISLGAAKISEQAFALSPSIFKNLSNTLFVLILVPFGTF